MQREFAFRYRQINQRIAPVLNVITPEGTKSNCNSNNERKLPVSWMTGNPDRTAMIHTCKLSILR
jgi:hypothetical protein